MQRDTINVAVGGGMSSVTMQGQVRKAVDPVDPGSRLTPAPPPLPPPQYVFSLAGIPQVGFSATAPSLSNSTVYPTFSRVVPSDVSQGQLLAELVAALGWKYVSVLSSTDVYSQELAAVFRASCRDLGIIFVTEQSFSATSTVRELGSDMEDLKAAKANVRLLIAGSEEIAMVALQAAYEAGLSGPNEVWLGVDGGCTGFAGCGGAPPLALAD